MGTQPVNMRSKIIIVFLLLSSLLGIYPQRTSSEELIIPHTLEEHVKVIFGDKAEVAMAVLKYESGLKLDAINYNCRYNGKSKSCKKKDRNEAWSVDCGIAQINVKGKYCPASYMTLEGNMEQVEKIYKEQGLDAWVAYSSGKYKKYLITS